MDKFGWEAAIFTNFDRCQPASASTTTQINLIVHTAALSFPSLSYFLHMIMLLYFLPEAILSIRWTQIPSFQAQG